MKQSKLTARILLVLFALLALFHLFVIIGAVPHDIIRGGRIKEPGSNFLLMEIVAILILLLFAIIVLFRVGYFKAGKLWFIPPIATWLMFAYFAYITYANLMSPVQIENLVFAPLSGIMALLTIRLALAGRM